MTAFARLESRTDAGMLTWEIRSLNHRYLEISLRLPENFLGLEAALREQIRNRLQRGKIEVNLRYQVNFNNASSGNINEDLLQFLLATRRKIANHAGEALAPIDGLDLLRWPDLLQTTPASSDDLQQTALNSFASTLQQLVDVRAKEGKTIQELLEQRLSAMQAEVAKVHSELPLILQWQREKLLHRFQEIQLNLDSNRLEQEMVMFAQKIDVAEEIDRLRTHIEETRRTLQMTSAQGRRLDFLAQELHREANTLASKSVNSTTTLAAVQLKVLIEQVREQVQNIE